MMDRAYKYVWDMTTTNLWRLVRKKAMLSRRLVLANSIEEAVRSELSLEQRTISPKQSTRRMIRGSWH